MIATMHAAHPEASTRWLCGVLRVSRSGVYAARGRRPVAEDPALRQAMTRIGRAHPSYGYRRMTAALRRQGRLINGKRVRRLMRLAGLGPPRRATPVRVRDAAPRSAPNLLRDAVLTGPNQAWVVDLTYLPFPRSTGYLACVLDAWSRRCIGWALGAHLTTDVTVAALDRAIATRQPPPGLIHHSDQGVQYANHRYRAQLAAIGAQISLSAPGRPTENARAEAFFSTLKREEVGPSSHQNLTEARRGLSTFLDEVDNETRLHSRLGYRPPAEFEAAH